MTLIPEHKINAAACGRQALDLLEELRAEELNRIRAPGRGVDS